MCFVPFRQCEKGHPPPASSALPAWKPPPSPGSAGTAPSSHLRDHNPRPHSCRDSSFLLGRELTPGAVQAGIGSASDCILAACKGQAALTVSHPENVAVLPCPLSMQRNYNLYIQVKSNCISSSRDSQQCCITSLVLHSSSRHPISALQR